MNITDTTPVNPALAITTIDPDGLNGMAVKPLRMLELVQAMDDKKREIYGDKSQFDDAGQIVQVISYVSKTPEEFANLVFMTGQKMSGITNPDRPIPTTEEMKERLQLMKGLVEVGRLMSDLIKDSDEKGEPKK